MVEYNCSYVLYICLDISFFTNPVPLSNAMKIVRRTSTYHNNFINPSQMTTGSKIIAAMESIIPRMMNTNMNTGIVAHFWIIGKSSTRNAVNQAKPNPQTTDNISQIIAITSSIYYLQNKRRERCDVFSIAYESAKPFLIFLFINQILSANIQKIFDKLFF